MPLTEPIPTALLLAVFGALMTVSVVLSGLSGRIGIPIALLFLAIGMVAGSEGLGRLSFQDYQFTFRLGTAGLVLILFDGGLNTPLSALKSTLAPAAVLATAGVVATALLVAFASRAFDFSWNQAMLLGAIVASTDAAAVFSVLRGSGVYLKRRVGATLELESGLNDPMAVALTVTLTESLALGQSLDFRVWIHVGLGLIVGGLLGVAFGYAGRWLLARVRLAAGGLYPVLTLALAFLAFSIPTLLHGSGFLAVYVAAVMIANTELPYRSGILRVHDSAAWISQVAMFLLLGLLVHPSRLLGVAWEGLTLALFMALMARPVVVLICLLPFGYPLIEKLYIGWLGLRGAVPIILATVPILAEAPGAQRIFDLVFFIVAVNCMVPGATVRAVTRWLGLQSSAPPPPHAILEVSSVQALEGKVLSFYIEPASAVSGVAVGDLPIPEGSAVMLIVRGRELIAPKAQIQLTPGDHVYVLCRQDELSLVQLMFGRSEEG